MLIIGLASDLMPPFVEKKSDVLYISLSGRIDHSNADNFRNDVISALDKYADDVVTLVLDVENVDYMSSLGLRMLIMIRNNTNKRNINTILSNPNGVLSEILKISQFDKIFPIQINE